MVLLAKMKKKIVHQFLVLIFMVQTLLFCFLSLSLLFSQTSVKEEMEINKANNARVKPRFKNIIHLWEFLLELLSNENFCAIISWSRREQNEFKLKKPGEVARRWGILRQKKGMTYEKLSRSLRFYYGQGIIQKVSGK